MAVNPQPQLIDDHKHRHRLGSLSDLKTIPIELGNDYKSALKSGALISQTVIP